MGKHYVSVATDKQIDINTYYFVTLISYISKYLKSAIPLLAVLNKEKTMVLSALKNS